ncbi:MAG: N-acetylglucosamine-6-phosphate deacetylase [Oscillospiraceae bacterium]|nr:N-acetylglucosamine-6-phosphate deacetylase [Oscillospiraceae bacterium]
MRIENARVFRGGAFESGGIDFESVIRAAGAAVTGGLDAEGCRLIPGLVDIHSHGAAGADASDGDPEGLERMARCYAAAGVTAWCPTTMTLDEAALVRALCTVRDYRRPRDGAAVAGVNLEGPFLSREKCGAQDPRKVRAPDIALFRRLNEASGGAVRLVTLAPEQPGAAEFIAEACRECTVSLGHTTADYDTARKAFDAGASHVTHLFNAMPPLLHRAPGVIAAAFDADATVELIADGLHVHPSVVRMTRRLFGDRLALISDSVRCAGMPDGEYTLGGQPITLCGGRATLRDTETIAGSAITLMEGVRRAVRFGMPVEEAIVSATEVPARIIGMAGEIGTLEPGARADFVLLDDALDVRAVFIGGVQIAGEPLCARQEA